MKKCRFIKKLLSIVISVFVLNSFVINDYVYAAAQIQPVLPLMQEQKILNSDIAMITDYFVSPIIKNDLVVFIQDLHGNPSVQKNISEIIEELDTKYGIDTILLEGIPEGQADISVLQELKKYNVADALLKSNALTGPEYFLIKNNTNAKICGLENWSLYINNIKRNAQILEDNQYITETFVEFENNLFSKIDNIKNLKKIISSDLSDKKTLKEINQPIINYDALHKYISIYNNISAINKRKLKAEYSAFIEDLKHNLDINEYHSLINLSKKENLTEYYNDLYNKITSQEKDINKYNELYLFLKYTNEKSKLNLVSLISQQNKIFNNYLSSMSDNKMQQNLFIVKMTQLFKNFLSLSISDEDYNFFINNYERYINLLPTYLAQDYYDYEDLLLDDLLFEYHQTNIDRNKIFVDNITKSLKEKENKKKLTIVIAGGFHNSISQYLKDKNISYLFITPSISGQTTNTFYNEIVSSTNRSALAPIKIMLANTGLLQAATISVFFESLVNALTSGNNYSPEETERKLLSIIGESEETISPLFGNIPISIKRTNSAFIIDIDGQELKFKVENGQIIWENASVNYNNYTEKQEKKQLIEKLLSLLRKHFGIYQATSMKLNPHLEYSSSFFSKRLGNRKSLFFNLSMFFSAIKAYNLAYGLLMSYIDTKPVKNNVSRYDIDFDKDPFFDYMKNKAEFKSFANKKVTVFVEKGLEEYLTEESIKEILKDSIKRVGGSKADFKGTLFIGFLDKSTNLFEDHLNNGFIGVNRAIFEVEDNTIKEALLKTGIIHEIAHELKGKLSSEDYRNFENLMMYNDIKYIIDFVARHDYSKDTDQILTDKEVAKIKNRINNAFFKTNAKGQRVCLFADKSRFLKKLAHYKYFIEELISVVNKKNLLEKGRKYAELVHMEELLSPSDNDENSFAISRKKQEDFFSELIDSNPNKFSTAEEFLEKRIEGKGNTKEEEEARKKKEKRIKEVKSKQADLYSKYAGILNLFYTKNKIDKDDLELLKNIPDLGHDKLKELEDILDIKEFKDFEHLSEKEKIKIIKLNNFITHFNSCLNAMYKVMPTWMFESFYDNNTVVAEHALDHSMEVLSVAMDIMSLDFNQKVDMKTLIYSSLLHDISCTFFRQNHETNSAVYARTILTKGSTLSEKEIDKICVVGRNHKKYKEPLEDNNKETSSKSAQKSKEKALRPAHDKSNPNYCYEACLLHDADGLTATLDFGRVLEVWLKRKERFLNKELKASDRQSLIKKGLYLEADGGDAINDLMRQFYRRHPNFYLTTGGKEFAKLAFEDQHALIKFVYNYQDKIKNALATYHPLGADFMDRYKKFDEEIEYAITVINDTFSTGNFINGYERISIEQLREILKVKTEDEEEDSFKKRIFSFVGKESSFGFFSKILTLYKILLNKTSHSNIILSDMHGGYNRFSEILIKMLDPTYNINEIMRTFNEADLIKQGKERNLTDEELDKIEETEKKLNRDIISRIKTIKKNIYILGDMLDRGDKQFETFELLNQISKTEKLRYIMGNHDIYAFMNLLGLHLPFYEDYKGIYEDYTVEVYDKGTKKNIKVLNLLKAMRTYGAEDNREPKDDEEVMERKIRRENAKSKNFWAEKLYEYMQYADSVQKEWTKYTNKNGITKEQELQEFFTITFDPNHKTDSKLFKLDSKGKDVLNEPSIVLNSDNTEQHIKDLFSDPKFINFHKKFFGRNVGVVVYTGIRAVNKMSINWWKDRNDELTELKINYPQYTNYWNRLQYEINSIITEQQDILDKKYSTGDWGWLVIDSIMYRNYESTEWNALDWVFHNNWGGGENGFLNQLNKKIERRNKKMSEKMPFVTPATYFDNPYIKELLEFYRKNFYLYRIDHFGNCYMHSLLPVDDNGEVSIGYVDESGVFVEKDKDGVREKGFVYKHKRYRNKTILKGLGKIAKDVRNYNPEKEQLSEIREALTMITAVYADNTTRIKPANLKEMKEKFGGFFSILNKMGISTLVVGHNPISKINKVDIKRAEAEIFKVSDKYYRNLTILSSDGEMSSGYQKPHGAGLGIEVSLLGVRYRGFLKGDSKTFSNDYTPDVLGRDMKFTTILNIFPLLKKLLILTKRETTLVMSSTEGKIKEEIEPAFLNGISTIAIIPNRLKEISSQEKIIEQKFIMVKNMSIPFTVYANKILAGNGKDITCLSYEYDKSSEISDEEIEFEINKYILEQIKNKTYKKHGVKPAGNILTNVNIYDGTPYNQSEEMAISDNLREALTKSFKEIPLLYDLNLQRMPRAKTLITDINIDKIRDLLSAA